MPAGALVPDPNVVNVPDRKPFAAFADADTYEYVVTSVTNENEGARQDVDTAVYEKWRGIIRQIMTE